MAQATGLPRTTTAAAPEGRRIANGTAALESLRAAAPTGAYYILLKHPGGLRHRLISIVPPAHALGLHYDYDQEDLTGFSIRFHLFHHWGRSFTHCQERRFAIAVGVCIIKAWLAGRQPYLLGMASLGDDIIRSRLDEKRKLL